MTTQTEIVESIRGYTVNVYAGPVRYEFGPYRFKFWARFVAWLEEGQH